MKRLQLIFFLCIAALFARPAVAAAGYFDGAYATPTPGTICTWTGLTDYVLQSKTGYWTDMSAHPKTGEVTYVHAVGANISGCYNADAFGPEFFLPDGASFAVSATNKVHCWAGKLDGSVTPYEIPNDANGSCSQTYSIGSHGGAWFGWSALPPGWWLEVQVPYVFNKKLTGPGGTGSRLNVAATSVYPPYNVYPFQDVTVWYQAAFQNLASSGVTSTSANVAFDLMSYYHDGLLYIDYGTTNPPPSSSSSSAIPATGLSYPVLSSLAGLNPSTIYYWRARFVTSDGTFSSPVQNFTTSVASGPQTLTVSKNGTGTGTVTSAVGINCGATCSASVAFGSSAMLTASPTTGSMFTAWAGSGCTGTAPCTVTMTAARSVTATFMREIGSLSVTLGGLPAFSSVTLGIAGPDGFSTTHTMTTGTGFNWSDVSTGTYTVTPPTVTISGKTYSAQPQSAVVNFGATATINVIYQRQGGSLVPILMLLLE